MEKLTRQVVGKPVLPIKVLQFGSGNFLRGFVEYIVDVINEHGYNGGVAVVKNRPGLSMLDMQQQDGVFTLFTEGIKDGHVVQLSRLITAIHKMVNPYDDYTDYLNLATEPELKLVVSNTTESGIYFDPSDANLADGPHQSFAAKLTAFLYKRFIYFKGDPEKGLFILPCELIENNGKILHDIVLQYIDLWQLEEDFSIWLSNYTHFYNTLVDRIVSGYPKENEAKYTAQLKYADKLITICEPYLLWAIEGDAALADYLPLQHFENDIVLVQDLTPYRTRKVRILNGAHTLMAQIGLLRNLETVGQCMQDAFTSDFILHAIHEEILPTLSLPTAVRQRYAAEVLDRFRNPYLRHYLVDIAQNTVMKFKTRLLPVIVDYVGIYNSSPKHLIFALAALIHLRTQNEQGVLSSDLITSKENHLAQNKEYEVIVSNFLSENQFSDQTLREDIFLLPLANALQLIHIYGLENGYRRF